MSDLTDRWSDLPDYIIGVTKQIWEDRGVATLREYYADDLAVRSPMGIQHGNEDVIATTMATIHEFPDRQLYGEDVIWNDDPEHGLLSSHRLITTATHANSGQFGDATGKTWTVRLLADCAVRNDTIYDEWLVRDYGGMVRQMGLDPRDVAQAQLDAGQSGVFRPEEDTAPKYKGRGNDNRWGRQYADILTRIMAQDFGHINEAFDRAVQGGYAGAMDTLGREASVAFWVGLRASFPRATFRIHHQIGMESGLMPPRAALRWSLDGRHDGWGVFGKPSGKPVHVFGMSHAEFGPWGLRREYALYDEIAIWKQILMDRDKA